MQGHSFLNLQLNAFYSWLNKRLNCCRCTTSTTTWRALFDSYIFMDSIKLCLLILELNWTRITWNFPIRIFFEVIEIFFGS